MLVETLNKNDNYATGQNYSRISVTGYYELFLKLELERDGY
jgi:hypothetical protein